MEPAFRQSDENQSYCRVRRIGQKAKRVYSYRAYCSAITIEDGIMRRQQMRAWVEEQTLKARANLEEDQAKDYQAYCEEDSTYEEGEEDSEEDPRQEYA